MVRTLTSIAPFFGKLAAGTALLLAFLYFATKVLDPHVASVDMKFIWLAGLLWSEGISPYGSDYILRAQEIFVDTNVPQAMLYPPYWYPWARLFALLPVEQAQHLWGYMSGMMILAGSALITMTFWPLRSSGSGWWIAAFLVFVLCCTGTAQSISMGQTAPILLLGLALFLYGLTRRSLIAICAALVLLMLKPHVGLPFAAFALIQRDTWAAVLWAAALSVVASLPAVLPYGLLEVARDYLEMLHAHDSNPVFAPMMLTGYANVTHYLFGWDSSGFGPVVMATLAAAVAALWLRRVESGARTDARLRLTTALSLLAGVMFIVPLHTYDLLLAAPILFLPCLLRPRYGFEWTAWGAALIILFRPNNLAQAAGLVTEAESYFSGSALASVALLVLWLLSLALVARAARER